MYARNSANNADILLIGTSTSVITIGNANSAGITFNTAAGNQYFLQNNGTTEYTFNATSSDWALNTMSNMGNIVDLKRGTDLTDADVTKTVSDGYVFVLPPSTLSTNRAFTASLTGVVNGHVMTVKRYDTSANTYAVKNSAGTTLFTMPASTKYFCTIWKNPLSGTDWLLFNHGGLQ
jgi:phosphoglucomutase